MTNQARRFTAEEMLSVAIGLENLPWNPYTDRAARILREKASTEAQVAGLVEVMTVLTEACLDEFGCDDRNEDGDYIFEDEDTVSDPDCSITFGMLRRAREALSKFRGEDHA